MSGLVFSHELQFNIANLFEVFDRKCQAAAKLTVLESILGFPQEIVGI